MRTWATTNRRSVTFKRPIKRTLQIPTRRYCSCHTVGDFGGKFPVPEKYCIVQEAEKRLKDLVSGKNKANGMLTANGLKKGPSKTRQQQMLVFPVRPCYRVIPFRTSPDKCMPSQLLVLSFSAGEVHTGGREQGDAHSRPHDLRRVVGASQPQVPERSAICSEVPGQVSTAPTATFNQGQAFLSAALYVQIGSRAEQVYFCSSSWVALGCKHHPAGEVHGPP